MTQPTFASSPSSQRPTARDVRQLLLGQLHDRLAIRRQAYRLRAEDTDELVQIHSGNDHWIASRLADHVSIWACHDTYAADEQFDRLAPSSAGWIEARPDRRSAPLGG